MKILFLLKKNSSSSGYQTGPRSGLFNSASILAHQLHTHLPHVHTHLAVCVDGNSVDKEVHSFRPDVVIIEALWVSPEKISELSGLYPHIHWVVRIHSETPFLSNEGLAFQYINKYSHIHNVKVAVNSHTTFEELNDIYSHILYLPNVYEDVHIRHSDRSNYFNSIAKFALSTERPFPWHSVNIGCFGAIRPLKNQLFQAVAAIRWANQHRKHLIFHINSERIEQGGESVLKNIRALFEHTSHTLVEHGWLKRREFLDLVSYMDVGLQVSFTESFNIVSADFVGQGVPIIASPSVRWLPEWTMASTINPDMLVNKISQAIGHPSVFRFAQKFSLDKYNKEALSAWKKYIHDVTLELI